MTQKMGEKGTFAPHHLSLGKREYHYNPAVDEERKCAQSRSPSISLVSKGLWYTCWPFCDNYLLLRPLKGLLFIASWEHLISAVWSKWTLTPLTALGVRLGQI